MKRMSIAEAADTLGVTRDAIRKRVKRQSIEWEVDPSGETFVYLDASGHNGDASETDADASGRDGDTSETDADASGRGGDTSADTSRHALVESLQDQVEYLRREVEVWQEESRRKDHLLARALERIPPQLETPETPQAPESADESTQRAEPPADAGEAQEGGEPRSWWRRLFGG